MQLFAPVPRPGKIVAIGRNYADHAKETGVSLFEKPRIISKLPSSVCGPGSHVPRPEGVAKLDFEVELAVVIGAFAQRVPMSQALSCVAGYTVLDDVSAREFQFDLNPAQTTFAKSMDRFCPMGPWLEPGVVIATGTPAGIGAFRNPPVWLQPGDHIRMEISRIGVLEHEIAA